MFSVSRVGLLLLLLVFGASAYAPAQALRVCTDPANLPYSDFHGQGFEDQLARWIAHDLGRDLQLVWLPNREHFVEKRLKAGTCDLMLGVPTGYGLMVPSRVYYRSTYVFVSRRERNITVNTLNDPQLKNYRIGLHFIGDDETYVPPAIELAKYGMSKNIVGYSIYGNPVSRNPAAELVTAVAKGDIDLAVVWGPIAGYFAKNSDVPLRVVPICQPDPKQFPVIFGISVGVRRGENDLLAKVNDILCKRDTEIHALLNSYGVPMLDIASEQGCN